MTRAGAAACAAAAMAAAGAVLALRLARADLLCEAERARRYGASYPESRRGRRNS